MMVLQLPFSSALVTGGAGFIGSHIASALVAAGCRVTVLDNLATGHIRNLSEATDRITFIEGDIRDEALLAEAMAGCEVVFHEAAVVSVPKTVEDPVGSTLVNDLGTLQVLEAARKAGVRRVVLASSSAIYGDDPALPKEERMCPRPQTPYAIQKLTGEYYAKVYHDLYGMETVCLRYFNVFGPRQDPSSAYSGVISIFMSKAAQNLAPAIYGDGGQTRDFVCVSDVAAANLLAASVPGVGGKVFNIGTGTAISILALWDLVQNLAGSTLSPTFAPPRAGDIRESVSDIGLAASLLGFSPQKAFAEGLKETYEWYQEERRRA